MPRSFARPFEDCRRDLERIVQQRQLTQTPEPDLSRGAVRFAAEAMLASLQGDELPEAIMQRALLIAGTMVRG